MERPDILPSYLPVSSRDVYKRQGVDSSVVVHQLKEAGYDPTIFYIRIGMEDKDGYIDCPAEEDIEITSYIAKKYGCRFEIVSLHDEYWDRVVSYTIDSCLLYTSRCV